MSAFDNATLMITGGTGSFGSTVLKHFLDSDGLPVNGRNHTGTGELFIVYDQ